MKKLFGLIALSLFISFNSGVAQDIISSELSPEFRDFSFGQSQRAIWDVLFNYDLQAATGGLGNAGAVYIPTLNQFWVSRWSTPAGRIYVLNTSGVVIDSFTTQGFTGTRNMAFDGQYVYHAITTNVLQKVDPVTRLTVGTITMPTAITARFISYDPNADGGNGGFWVGNWNTGALNYYLVSKTNGSQLAVIPNTTITGTYGIAYDYWSIGGPFLWVWSQGGGQGTPQNIIQISVATGTPTGVQRNVLPDIAPSQTTAIAGGMFITPDLIPGKVVMGGVLQGTPDRLFGYELFVLDAGVLAPFNLTSPAPGVTVTSVPNSSVPVTITWDTSRASATYKWIFGAPTVPPRLLTMSTGTNSLTLTLGQLDNLLAGLGVAQGDSVIGEWDVWAFRNNPPDFDSLKSANGPRAITLKRFKPPLIPFSLVSPPNNITVTTSAFNNTPINITWNKSGEAVTYKWKFGTGLDFETPKAVILSLPSNNGGYDTVLTVVNSALDAILAGLGIAPGDSSVGEWTVYAYSGNDSLKATETFNITLKRQAKGEVLIAYDSTNTACRASRDSVIQYLNSKGKTFDLFNRGTQTSTNVISFRGYKYIIWLGEGTSVMSVVQKDSIKAYLNNPPSGQRSNLIIFSEDIGYQFGRSSSTYLDLDFMNNYLGANYVLDRPSTGANQGYVGSYINTGLTDSTVGSWPDVLSRFDPGSTHDLYKFRADGATGAIGKVGATFNVCTHGVDIESMRWAADGPGISPYRTRLDGSFFYVDTDGLIPVELTSFTAVVSGNSVSLNWSTATELNNSGFQVERKTIGSEFTSVGFVKGQGTTTQSKDYVFVDQNLAVGKYIYRLKQIDFDGTHSYSPEIEVEVGLPTHFELSQNYPNPFNPSTTIKFSLVTDSKVTLKLFDLIGQEVATILNTDLAAGYHSVVVDASSLSTGVYFYRLDASGTNGQKYSSVKKMLLTK